MRVTSVSADPLPQPVPSRSLAATARRAQIVEATIGTIAEVGYGQTTYNRIAQRAGLSSTRLISYHFGSRDELMEQVLIEVGRSAERAISERVQVEVTASGRLRARIEAELGWIARCPAHAAEAPARPALRPTVGRAPTPRRRPRPPRRPPTRR